MAEGEAPEYVLAELLSGLPAKPGDGVVYHLPPPPVVVPMRLETRWRRGRLRDAPLAEEMGRRTLPADELRRIERALAVLENEIPEDPLELDRSLKALIEARTELELDLARLLRNFRAFGLARQLGFGAFKDYVAERLGISVDRARFLVRLDRRLIHFPEVRRAVRRGQIGTVAGLLVCRIATPERTERAWVDRACNRTVQRLKKEVEWAERETGKSWVGGILPPPPGRLPSDLDAVTAEVIAACAAVDDEQARACGSLADEGAIVDGTRVDEGASSNGSSSGDRRDETFAHPIHHGRPVRVDFRLRESAVELWQEAGQRLGAVCGRSHLSDEQVLYEAALAFLVTYLPLWLHEIENGDPIAVRDRFQCLVPGCTIRCGSAHHVRFRSQGGPDEEWNLAFLCHPHHLELLHQRGFIRVHGRAPDRLVFELGIRPDGTATEVFVNEERLGDHVTRMLESKGSDPRGRRESTPPDDDEAHVVDRGPEGHDPLPQVRADLLRRAVPGFAEASLDLARKKVAVRVLRQAIGVEQQGVAGR
jgi:hypothetical protein